MKTIRVMVRIYCRGHHESSQVPCPECAGLLKYAEQRIEKCPFGSDKPVCNRCSVHCYKPEMRERIREIMRYAGPRMPFLHPVLAIRHLIRSRMNYFIGRSK
ncbi:MAG: nitrous oxide-stimulated promoter family protein [Pontiellaceae bacterium]|nr:nitrous oxide-stimulated promoter family protein [Pontiellaceae bacterium]